MDSDMLYNIYELYFERFSKEADLIWLRFKNYLWFNTALFVAIGFFLQLFRNEETIFEIDAWIWISLCAFSSIGIIFSILFNNVNKDGKRWQLIIDEEIRKIENKLFRNRGRQKNMGLYTRILDEYTNQYIGESILEKNEYRVKPCLQTWFGNKKPIDVVDINITTSKIFGIIWSILVIIFFVLVILKSSGFNGFGQ